MQVIGGVPTRARARARAYAKDFILVARLLRLALIAVGVRGGGPTAKVGAQPAAQAAVLHAPHDAVLFVRHQVRGRLIVPEELPERVVLLLPPAVLLPQDNAKHQEEHDGADAGNGDGSVKVLLCNAARELCGPAAWVGDAEKRGHLALAPVGDGRVQGLSGPHHGAWGKRKPGPNKFRVPKPHGTNGRPKTRT